MQSLAIKLHDQAEGFIPLGPIERAMEYDLDAEEAEADLRSFVQHHR